MTESTDKQLPDEQQLDDYLKGDSSVSRQYRQLHSAEVPAELDRLVLRQAADAVKSRRPSWMRWTAPLAVAASAVVVLSIVVETGVRDETAVLHSPAATIEAKRREHVDSSADEAVVSEQAAPASGSAAPGEFAAGPSGNEPLADAPPEHPAPAVPPPPKLEAPAPQAMRSAAPVNEGQESAARSANEAQQSADRRMDETSQSAARSVNEAPQSVAGNANDASQSRARNVSETPQAVAENVTEATKPVAQKRPPPPPVAAPARSSSSSPAVMPARSVSRAAEDAARLLNASSLDETARKESASAADEARLEEERTAAQVAFSRQISAEMQTSPRTYTDPEEWLKAIRELRKENKQEEADQEWRRFRTAFPNHEVAETDTAREAKK